MTQLFVTWPLHRRLESTLRRQSHSILPVVWRFAIIFSFVFGISVTMTGSSASATTVNAVTTCTLYTPTHNGVDNRLRSRLIAGITNIDNKLVDEAINDFKHVIDNTDGDHLLDYIARNNLVCAYLLQASLAAKGDNLGLSSYSCTYSVLDAMDIRSSMQLQELDEFVDPPNIPNCDGLDIGLETLGFPYPIQVFFSLYAESQIDRVTVNNLHYLLRKEGNEYPPLILDLVKGNPAIERRVPTHGIYCYVINYSGGLLADLEKGALHIPQAEEEEYILRPFDLGKMGTAWRFHEKTKTFELIFADKMEFPEIAKTITITTNDGEEKAEFTLNQFNRVGTAEIDVANTRDIAVTINIKTTFSNGDTTEIEGTDILRAVDVGQIYVIDEFGEKPYLRETTCDDYINAENSLYGTGFGVNSIDETNSASGLITSWSGDRWTFEGLEGEVVEITISSDDMDIVLELYGQRDKLIKPRNVRNNIQSKTYVYTLPSSTRYSIITKGRHYAGRDIETGAYSLDLEKERPTSTIQYGDRITGYIDGESVEQRKFEGDEGDSVVITMHSDEIDTKLELYDAAGRSLGIKTHCHQGTTIISRIYVPYLPAKDDYLIHSKQYGIWSSGSYNLTLNRESRNSTTIIYGTVPDRTADCDGDIFVFERNAGASVDITMDTKDMYVSSWDLSAPDANELYTHLGLYTPSGILIDSGIYNHELGEFKITLGSLPKTQTGQYYIAAKSGYNDAGSPYTLLLRNGN